MGAWIETASMRWRRSPEALHPMWVRGLKLNGLANVGGILSIVLDVCLSVLRTHVLHLRLLHSITPKNRRPRHLESANSILSGVPMLIMLATIDSPVKQRWK